tara:strand:+ start:215 stop:508 length:294 start_codon:yes stop_codon:yes gene_type:complete
MGVKNINQSSKNGRLNRALVFETIVVTKRWLWISLMVGFLVLLDVATVVPVASQPVPGDYARPIAFGGRTRTYNIHVPSTYVAWQVIPPWMLDNSRP